MTTTAEAARPAPGPAADEGLARRLRALACTAPLHDLDSRKANLAGEYAVYGMAEIALAAIDLVTLHMDFDTGADRDQVLARMLPRVAAQAPEREWREHERVSKWVLESLINVGSVDRGFRAVYGTFGADGSYIRRDYDFKLIEEVPGPDGGVYLRTTDEAVNVLVGALDTDVTSAQIAAEVAEGKLAVRLDDGRTIEVAIERAHLEEDAGKSLHEEFHGATGIDLNRAGTPLLEIVSKPVLYSAAEAVAYMRTVHTLVRWLGVCDGNMQEGSFRCDANVSVRPVSSEKLGTRTEIKNVNSFRFVEKAIEYEIERQIRALENGERIVQETRLYDPARHQTRPMRGKEDANDYRYFPDPDLPPLAVTADDVAAVKATMPELPEARRVRYVESLGLPEADAMQLCTDRATADYFEAVLAALPGEAKLAANWTLGEVSAALNEAALAIEASRVSAHALAQLLARVREGVISGKIAKDVFAAMWAGEGSADEVIEKRGLKQISDSGALAAAIDAVLAEYPTQLADFRGGNEKLLQFFVGQVMKRTRGQANPQQLNALLREKLKPE